MDRIPDAAQLKMWDAETLRAQGLSSWALMERAAHAFIEVLRMLPEFPKRTDHVLVVCGPGNNGGDGLAIARLLFQDGFSIRVVIPSDAAGGSVDFKENLRLLPADLPVLSISDFTKHGTGRGQADLIIDALFGVGLARPLEGEFADAVRAINAIQAHRISVDVPSGMRMDRPSEGPVVQAHRTITFQCEKLAFLLPENMEATGDVSVADIGLDPDFQMKLDSPYSLIRPRDIRQCLPLRKKASHKGNHGHALIIAGSLGKVGAAVLSTRAALRTGCGLATAQIPGCGYTVLQSAVPEALVMADKSDHEVSELCALGSFRAVAAGPGLGQGTGATRLVRQLLERVAVPLVLDADALNILAADSGLFHLLPEQSILTPHPGEFRRLAGDWKNDFDRLEMLRRFSSRSGAIVVLKGPHTAVAFPDGRVSFNTSGNPWMATAGSGDVLTGIIVSLLAQGRSPEEAALTGVFVHGAAGDRAAAAGHPLIAGDLIEALPGVLTGLKEKG